ncbi:MAG: ATP-grasp domain-containing protein [Flavobacteriales bacterium]
MDTVIVTGIGGVVGQGIVRNIRATGLPVRIVGINVSAISAGNHLCDAVHVVPYAVDANYISAVAQITREEEARVIIPSTDYESYHLALHADKLPSPVAASPHHITLMCLDKYKTFQAFQEHHIPFAPSCLPSEFKHQWQEFIAKPREGRGSRGILISPKNPEGLDDAYMIQPLLKGPEITTTAYVTQSGDLHGIITMRRFLESGNTTQAEVTFEYNAPVQRLVESILRVFPFRGSFNVQSIVTEGGIIPFEINCRISGTNSIRSQFGFKDVEYTLRELLYNESPAQPEVTEGCAVRVMHDVIYPNITLKDIQNNQDSFYIYG